MINIVLTAIDVREKCNVLPRVIGQCDVEKVAGDKVEV
jgi:hypothetical protein